MLNLEDKFLGLTVSQQGLATEIAQLSPIGQGNEAMVIINSPVFLRIIQSYLINKYSLSEI